MLKKLRRTILKNCIGVELNSYLRKFKLTKTNYWIDVVGEDEFGIKFSIEEPNKIFDEFYFTDFGGDAELTVIIRNEGRITDKIIFSVSKLGASLKPKLLITYPEGYEFTVKQEVDLQTGKITLRINLCDSDSITDLKPIMKKIGKELLDSECEKFTTTTYKADGKLNIVITKDVKDPIFKSVVQW